MTTCALKRQLGVLILLSFCFLTLISYYRAPLPRASGLLHKNFSYVPGSPVNDIFFLKIPKCASTSLMNIFMRYGKKHNLSFALPLQGQQHLGVQKPFTTDMLIPHPKGIYNVFSQHTRLRIKVMRTLMPNAKFVTIIRYPAAMLESYYSYNGLEKRLGVNFSSFMQDPEKFAMVRKYTVDTLRNVMLYYFGLDVSKMGSKKAVDDTIEMIRREFDLVMIAEKHEESLILLKDLLCWNLSDVVVLPTNVRISAHKTKLDKSLIKKVTEWNRGDYRLYKFFLKVFDENVKSYGEQKMTREIRQLKRLINSTKAQCISSQISGKDMQDETFKPYSEKTLAYTLKSNAQEFCSDLIKTGISFTQELQERQQRLFTNS